MINRFARRKLYYQKMEGRVIAKEILERSNLRKEIIKESCDTTDHHSLAKRDEAGWPVNIEEGISKDQRRLGKVIRKVFKIVAGRPLAGERYFST